MRFTLFFLTSVLVVSAQHYFHDGHRKISWQSPYSPRPFIDTHQPLIAYLRNPVPLKIYSPQNKNPVTSYADAVENRHTGNSYGEPFTFPDTELRFKGLSRERPSNEQLDARFLFANVYSNPFFKTATFTSRTSLSLTSFVTCVPANQILNGAAATTCRRKRSANDVAAGKIAEENQFIIAPSETQKLMTTAISSPSWDLEGLSSSKDDTAEQMPVMNLNNFRQQRFLFANGNQFVISTTVTSFTFSNATVTVTRNLFNEFPAVQCVPKALADMPQCIACLPSGFVVCNAAG